MTKAELYRWDIVQKTWNIVDKELREIGALFIKSSRVNLAS